MDYSKFLGKKDEVVLAYLGGPYAYGKDRRVRVDEPRPAPGFHRFEIKGRLARALGAVDAPDFGSLPKARGHHVAGWLCSKGIEPVRLLPPEEAAPFALMRARRWHSGDLVFEALDFDTEVEDEARLKLERLEPFGELKGATPSLRLAYSIALVLAVARKAGIEMSVREAAGAPRDVGEEAARIFAFDLQRRRTEEMERSRVRSMLDLRNARRTAEATLANAAQRAEDALDGAHARMLSSRNLGDGNLEVTFEFLGERIISVVDGITLQVHDSGVCLAGEDSLVTLDSLPGVIREAIETDRLVITRR